MATKTFALITGASGGIGEAFASVCAQNGHNLLLVSRDKAKLEQVKDELGKEIEIRILAIDLSRADAGEKISDYVNEHSLNINVLVNNAGFGDYGKLEDADRPKLLNMIDLNVRSLTELTHRFLPQLLRQKQAYILNVASIAAFLPGPGMSVYYATKHYVLAFSEGLSEELKDTSVSVTALCPGPTASGFQTASTMGKSSIVKGKILPTASSVAEFGYQAMLAKKIIAIPGLRNKLAAQSHRFLSRSQIRKMVDRAQNH